ncbi:hypothetical protein ACISMU_09135, partial [Campylobacter jejuni]
NYSPLFTDKIFGGVWCGAKAVSRDWLLSTHCGHPPRAAIGQKLVLRKLTNSSSRAQPLDPNSPWTRC